MRKLIVRILNLCYVAAAAVAVYALCTRPIFKGTVKAHFTKERMGIILSKAFNNGSSGESESRITYKASPDMNKYITEENIQNYFPNGYDIEIPVDIPVKSAFNFKNTKLLDDLIQSNLYKIVDNVVDSLNTPLHLLFKDIVEGYAFDTLREEINKQIESKFPGGAEASDEEIQQVFDDVYSLLDEGESVSVDDLAATILHGGENSSGVLDIINSRGRKYVAFDPQPSEEEVNTDKDLESEYKYFVEYFEYSHNTAAYNAETAYFVKESDSFVLADPQPTEEQVTTDIEAEEANWTYFVARKAYKHNTEPYDSSVIYYDEQPYTTDDVDEDKITDAMVESLEGVDGLVVKTPVLCDPQPTQEQVEADIAIEKPSQRVYYILDGEGNPILPTEYSSSDTYYTVIKSVNDIDTAMSTLIESFLNGTSGQSRSIIKSRAEQAKNDESDDTLKNAIREYLLKMIPQNISERTGTIGQKAPFIFLALVALFALPWAWFALVTLLRTFRKDKCWTRLGIVIWGALLQVIFGIALTYGTKYAWPALASRISALKEYANSINFDLRTGCLIPSFIWLGFVVTAIPYWIIRAPLKRRYKLIKRASRRDYYNRKRNYWINSEEH